MGSLKAIAYEQKLLGHLSTIKKMVLKNFDDRNDLQQEFLIELNSFFTTAHEESRRLRKALAFLHGKCDSYTDQIKNLGEEPDEFFGRKPYDETART